MSADAPQPIDGIAIIGMDGKFPGAPNLDVFWENLRNGVESVTHFKPEELEFSPADRDDVNMVNARAILAEVDQFDADFFGFNPREAEYTDPQHRLFLQTAFEALENAGYDADRFAGNIGMFAGCSQNTYLLANLVSNPEFLRDYLASQQMGSHPALLGNDKDFLSTRVSYKLNLRGPSMSVQSACSTSLVAVCQACQSLQNYQSDLALAGGVSITFPQKRAYRYEEGAIVSRDGHCRPFDVSCDGTVFGDGVGVVVLKRLDEAIRDGDHIRAVIRGFAVNNDGSAKVSYMAPSVEGQAEVIATAQALAGVDPNTITYIEAHGTGTSLGDPIEVAALTKAFRSQTAAIGFCGIGSVKGNVGHLEAAAGVAGLIKAVLCMENGELPPTLHFSQPNPRMEIEQTPFYVNAKLRKWERADTPLRAGVSSFGVGGTNAHVVLEEAPLIPATKVEAGVQLLTLSAKSVVALDRATERLGDHFRAHPDINLADAAFTLQTGRRVFNHRRVIVSSSREAALDVIAKRTSSHFLTGDTQGRKKEIAFLFPGQGAQEADMGRGLYENFLVYREQVDLCARFLQPKLGLDLREILYPGESGKAEAQQRLTQTYLTQPALFVVEYALAQTWLKWGVRPAIMLGHSLGEYVAACLAGVFSLEDALHLLAERGRLMQGLPAGTMLAVVQSEDELAPLLPEGLSLAAVNSAKVCVVSGPGELTSAWKLMLKEKGSGYRELATSHAFHSAMMDPILAPFEEIVRGVVRKPAQIPIVSTLYGRLATPEEWCEPTYWSGQLRQTVRFGAALDVLLSRPNLASVEVGPGQILTTLIRQHASKDSNRVAVYSLPRNKEVPDAEATFSALGSLWTSGVNVDWAAVHAPANRRRVPLPAYPFERKRYWVGATDGAASFSARESSKHAAAISVQTNGAPVPLSANVTGDEVEQLVAGQLQIMRQQLSLLRQMSSQPPANETSQS
jgi:phthiocerol/phenolphthiocerol synthesis type-I polyketide synthase E